MLSLLSALLQIVSFVMKYINEKRVEDAGRAKEIIAAWERNNGLVSIANKAAEDKRRELDADPDSVREHDEDERPN